MAQTEDNVLRIVLMGKTGSGKSATANTLLGRKEFESKLAPHAVTKGCQAASREWRGRTLLVVDTPGLFDTKETLDTTCREISQCVLHSAPGPHAVVMVVRLGRFTEEEKNTLVLIRHLFGDSVMKYTIFVFTGKEDLEDHSLVDFIKKSRDYLINIIQDCGSRYCSINNRAGEAEKEAQLQELMGLIEDMVQSNGGAYFSEAIYEGIEEKLKQKEEKLNKDYTDQYHKKIELVEKEDADKPQEERERKIEELRREYEEQKRNSQEEARRSLFDDLVRTVKDILLGIWHWFWPIRSC